MTRIEAEKILQRIFNIDQFYEDQWETISKILNGERILLIEKTGFGKSLCYQFPATQFPGLTIIFSPLIALMRDQVRYLKSIRISTECINSEQEPELNTEILEKAKNGKIKILYIAPERQENREWLDAVHGMEISMVVVDEAHCISLSCKEEKSREVIFFEPVSKEKITLDNIESQLRSFSIKRDDLTDNWVIADRSNAVILDKIRGNSVLLGKISTITKGATSGDREIFTVLKSFAEKGEFENELLKTSINSKDIKRYVLFDSRKYLIYTDNSTTIEDYPNIYKYLLKHRKKLSERNEVLKGMYPWYRLERPREKEIFNASEKLVVPYRAENNTFAYDNNQGFSDGGGSYTIAMKEGETTTIKYLLGILNSKLMNWFYGFIGKPKGKIREYFNRPLSLIPIKKISLTQQQPFIAFVDKILALTQSDDYLQNSHKQAKVKALESEIDPLVYKLYDLTPEEIKIVEGKN